MRLPTAVSLVLCGLLAAPVGATTLQQQRSAFVAAENALDRGAMTEFRRLEKRLRDYPLHGYLVYEALRKRLDAAGTGEITQFLEDYADTPLAWLLRRDWLNHLAGKRRWKTFLTYYTPSTSAARQCQYLQALIVTGRKAEAIPQVEEIWLHGKSQPRACDPVFKAWKDAGQRTPERVWQRIEKAMAAGQWRLADYLGRELSNRDRVWVKRWIRLHKSPDRATEKDRYRDAHPYRETMLAQAVRRLARWDGMRALGVWEQIRHRYPFTDSEVRRTEHYIVRNLVRVPDAEAYAFIRRVDVGADDVKVHAARIRAALLREDWRQVAAWIAALPDDERRHERWRYWLARALEGKGNSAAADTLYASVARERSYYGFLAADRIGADYHLEHNETPVSAELVAEIGAMDAVERARELFALERWSDARREWRVATKRLGTGQLKAAAKLAMQNGWHDRAIFTLARTGYWDDLELRFPLQHADLVEQNAKRHGIDIAWVFAVMRQESAFMSNARSHAGAMGLMQLMPATARSVARKMLKTRPPRRQELLQPDTNIALGSAYLKQMKGELGDSAILATAAYNAGPHRVTRWLPQRTLPADIWIELVPFKETRGYLRRVLAYTVIYEKRMGRNPKRLNERLHPVPPAIGQLSGGRLADSAG
ncbi:MAG: transglycosylase SLT domain-containing protein [Gammaproteobacteria bacterium]|nr:transglycosylase SLT domain-containing protein [Gammaproteobacteria bacterium]